jgi:hypothetical protein
MGEVADDRGGDGVDGAVVAGGECGEGAGGEGEGGGDGEGGEGEGGGGDVPVDGGVDEEVAHAVTLLGASLSCQRSLSLWPRLVVRRKALAKWQKKGAALSA